MLSILIYCFHYPCFRYRRIQKTAQHSGNSCICFALLSSTLCTHYSRILTKIKHDIIRGDCCCPLKFMQQKICFFHFMSVVITSHAATTTTTKNNHKPLIMENFHIACRNNHVVQAASRSLLFKVPLNAIKNIIFLLHSFLSSVELSVS